MPHSLLASRAAGVLLHVTSLPNGELDDHAELFVDWLAEAGQRWWQILPLAPPDTNGSPYAGLSAFATHAGLVPPDRRRPVTSAQVADFRQANLTWAPAWERFAGPDALVDQIHFARRWNEVRAHATARGVRIMGDLPLYVAGDGADRAAHPELFRDDGVSGCPPDYFSEDGQMWGNPLYNWDVMERDGFAWWVERLRQAFKLVDAVRIDHFRGLAAYWDIPVGHTARDGHWEPAPGHQLLTAITSALKSPALIAEDLGVITPDVDELRRAFDLTGMAVLQFEVEHHPAQDGSLWHEVDRVVYPGTHDNAPCVEWLESASPHQRWCLEESVRRTGADPAGGAWSFVQLAYAAPATTAIVSAQDLLGLGADARMNTPGRLDGNWAWRVQPDALGATLAAELRELVTLTNRSG